MVDDAAAGEGVGVLRIDLDRHGVVGNGAIVLALGPVGVAAAIEGVGVLRIDLDRHGVVGNGAIVLALGPMGIAAVVVGPGNIPTMANDFAAGQDYEVSIAILRAIL